MYPCQNKDRLFLDLGGGIGRSWGLGNTSRLTVFSVGAGMLSEVTDLPGIDELGWSTLSRLFGLSLLSALVCTYAFLVPMLSQFKALTMMCFGNLDEVIRLPLPVVVISMHCVLGGFIGCLWVI